MDLLEAFCDGRVQAQSAEEDSLSKPYTDEEDNMTYFKIEALMKYLRNNKFDTCSRLNSKTTQGNEFWFRCTWQETRFNTTKGESKQLRVW